MTTRLVFLYRSFMEEKHHQELINSITNDLDTILEGSQQAIYIYLDDAHKACNENFARLLGYDSPKDWAAVHDSFTENFVDKKSQQSLVTAYKNAMEKLSGSSLEVNWKTKTGKSIRTQVILVPIVHNHHLFALHFISKI